MTPEREPVDDAALIAEAERLASKEIEVEEMGTLKWDRTMISHLIRLARQGWQPPAPEPDRAEVLAKELWEKGSGPSLKDWEAIIRRHFDELGAEWEAERQVIDVPSIPGWLHDWARKALSGIFIYNPNISDEVDKQINDTMRAAEQIDEWAKVEKQLIDGAGVRAILRVAGEKM